MIINAEVDLPFRGCAECCLYEPNRTTILATSLEGYSRLETAWSCVHENRCKYIVKTAIGEEEFEKLINEVE